MLAKIFKRLLFLVKKATQWQIIYLFKKFNNVILKFNFVINRYLLFTELFLKQSPIYPWSLPFVIIRNPIRDFSPSLIMGEPQNPTVLPVRQIRHVMHEISNRLFPWLSHKIWLSWRKSGSFSKCDFLNFLLIISCV